MIDDISDAPAPDMPVGDQAMAALEDGVALVPAAAQEDPAAFVPAAAVATEEDAAVPAPTEAPAAAALPSPLDDLSGSLSAEDFAAAVDRTVVQFSEGSLVSGTVVRVDPDEVLVDIGFKSEGVIPASELSIRNNVNPGDVVKVGDPIEALVLQMEDQEGRLILSKKRAQYERAWGRIEGIMREGGTVTGQVIEVVKGGLIVDIGLRGFLPASLVELRRVRDLQPYVGNPLEAKVIELDKNRNNVVLSRRAYLEEEQAEQRQAFLDGLEPGEIRKGVVSSVVNFGAFVDLGGMDGLVHVSELSWQHVSHPGEAVSVGDQVMVKVLEVDRDRERISLSMRQTRDDPWESFSGAHQVGDVVDGAVTKTVPFGAFVSVTDGVEGLVHVSEIAMHHVESPELELSVGQAVKVKITEIDADRRRISLSIKQATPEWTQRSQWVEERRPPRRPKRKEFQREEEAAEPQPTFAADASLEAILQELKEKGIGRK
jgi:small subunit ribosomal protein S1